jgi:hypothetical protein
MDGGGERVQHARILEKLAGELAESPSMRSGLRRCKSATRSIPISAEIPGGQLSSVAMHRIAPMMTASPGDPDSDGERKVTGANGTSEPVNKFETLAEA